MGMGRLIIITIWPAPMTPRRDTGTTVEVESRRRRAGRPSRGVRGIMMVCADMLAVGEGGGVGEEEGEGGGAGVNSA